MTYVTERRERRPTMLGEAEAAQMQAELNEVRLEALPPGRPHALVRQSSWPDRRSPDQSACSGVAAASVADRLSEQAISDHSRHCAVHDLDCFCVRDHPVVSWPLCCSSRASAASYI